MLILSIFRPGYKKRIPGQGMPLMSNPDKFGDMIVEFDVEYPQTLTSDQKLYIKEALVNTQTSKKPSSQANNQTRKKQNESEDDD